MSKRRPNDRDRPGYFLREDSQFRPAPLDGASGEGSARPCYTFGITLAQVDALARLVQAVSAHGDVVAVGPMGDLAKGTLPQLGHERRGITADTAMRLARHFGGDPASWLALQSAYDLKTLPSLAEIEREVRPRAA